MDARTLKTYDAATAYAAEWLAQAPPRDMHALLRRWFRPGPTADVGCAPATLPHSRVRLPRPKFAFY